MKKIHGYIGTTFIRTKWPRNTKKSPEMWMTGVFYTLSTTEINKHLH